MDESFSEDVWTSHLVRTYGRITLVEDIWMSPCLRSNINTEILRGKETYVCRCDR